jgi:hypothetical protein
MANEVKPSRMAFPLSTTRSPIRGLSVRMSWIWIVAAYRNEPGIATRVTCARASIPNQAPAPARLRRECILSTLPCIGALLRGTILPASLAFWTSQAATGRPVPIGFAALIILWRMPASSVVPRELLRCGFVRRTTVTFRRSWAAACSKPSQHALGLFAPSAQTGFTPRPVENIALRAISYERP